MYIRQWDMTDRVKLCNCAGCGLEMVGESMRDKALGCYRDYPVVFGRLASNRLAGHRRPYCIKCYNDKAAVDVIDEDS